MNYTLKELLDIPRLHELLDSLDDIYSMPSAILDTEGNILTATGWQDICTKFHRLNPDTMKKCLESDRNIDSRLDENESYVVYQCPMGLVDAASPIVVEGKHIGNVFTGQFFTEEPDEAYFINQARQYGFDENDYLSAMKRVPVFAKEKMRNYLKFIHGLAQMLAEQGLQYKRQCETEEALRDSEYTFRCLFEDINNPISLLQDGHFTDCNAALLRLLGYTSKSDFLRRTPSEISPPVQPDGRSSEEKAAEMMTTALRKGSHSFEWLHTRADSTLVPVEVTLTPIVVGGNKILHTLWRDITERKQREEVLRQEQLFSKTLLDSLPCIFYLYSYPELRLLRWNKQHELLLGYNPGEIAGFHITDWHTQETKEAVISAAKAVMETGQSSIEAPLMSKNGELVYFYLTGVRLENQGKHYLLGTGIDITERKRAEDERVELQKQLLHVQKLESLGVLAGGIAHDFNNILLAIIGNADLALMRINKESPATENLHRIEKAALRAADLAKQMLAYSGKGRFVIENIDLNVLLEEMLHMLDVSISKNAVLRFNRSQSLPLVEADATQIRQIIMNLVINASEAIGDRSGVIAITTGCMECDKSYLKDVWQDESISEGHYVYLEIADTGCGMDKETLSRLFDPFFTTKFTGRGLGMAAVLGIVRGHKGTIKVYSETNKGTTFKVLLPGSASQREVQINQNRQNDEWKGTGTVLLVDDEETIRDIGTEMLKELGYTTVTANNGREAVDKFRNIPEITFVILDLTMPHMDGEQCFRELRKIKPDVKVIISSGFNEQEVTEKFVGKGLAGFIQKPYMLSALKSALKCLS